MQQINLKNKEKGTLIGIMTVPIIVCYIFYGIVQIYGASYLMSSICKVLLFGGIGIAYYYTTTKKNPLSLINRNKNTKYFKISLFIGIVVLAIVWIGYFLFKSFIDLDLIKEELITASNITNKTYPFVALYITLINSFLEEIFFRGIIFLQIYSLGYKKLAYIFSSGLFAIYHVSIFETWFNPLIIILALIGLFIGGCIFNYLNSKSDSILNSWMVHACANIAIVTIGFFMFYS